MRLRLQHTAAALFVVGLLATRCGGRTPPRLMVVVAVDQMRPDYLTRFEPQFDGGLARLLREGAFFPDTRLDYARTQTAPGHATIASGVLPARSGIVGNSFWDRSARVESYAVADASYPVLDNPDADGRSPANLNVDTLGDWLRESSPRSRVFAVGIKDRAAILLGGRRPDAVYWFDRQTGRFTTSAYYLPEVPRWVREFNDETDIPRLLTRVWERLRPEPAYALSREDAFPAEADGVHTSFPHVAGEQIRSPDDASPPYAAVTHTPFADELTFELARRLVGAEGLGDDEAPDLLWIALAAADAIGHLYGPHSQEVQDYYLRLDRMLGELFAFLDGSVGAGRYAVVLCSDHGVQPLPEELLRRGEIAGRVSFDTYAHAVETMLAEEERELGVDPRAVQPHFVNGIALDAGALPDEVRRTLRRRLAERLRSLDYVADAFTSEELEVPEDPAASAVRPFLGAYRRAFDPRRSPDVALLFLKNHLVSNATTMTTHGSPYEYDERVPSIFFGAGVRPGRYDARIRSVDIAPTLARMLRIRTPADLDGRSLDGWID